MSPPPLHEMAVSLSCVIDRFQTLSTNTGWEISSEGHIPRGKMDAPSMLSPSNQETSAQIIWWGKGRETEKCPPCHSMHREYPVMDSLANPSIFTASLFLYFILFLMVRFPRKNGPSSTMVCAGRCQESAASEK